MSRAIEKATQYLYQNHHISRVIKNDVSYAMFRHEEHPLATLPSSCDADLLATDRNKTVLAGTSRTPTPAYTPYGDRLDVDLEKHLFLGFNGEPRLDPRCYFLGNGYRTYNPALMRFHSSDSESPFQNGGVNAYAYCLGDPVNLVDPSGNVPMPAPRPELPLPNSPSNPRALPHLRTPNATRRVNFFSSGNMNEAARARGQRRITRDLSNPLDVAQQSSRRNSGTIGSLSGDIQLRSDLAATLNKNTSSRQSSSIVINRSMLRSTPLILRNPSVAPPAASQLALPSRSYYRSTGAMSPDMRFLLTLGVIAGTGGGLGYGMYKLVKALRENRN